MAYVPPPGAVMGRNGVWLMPNGQIAPGQTLPDGTPLTRTTATAAGGAGRRQQDAQGRWYFMSGNQRIYLSPVATGQASQGPEDASFFHTGSQWNQNTGTWDNPIAWDRVASLVILGGVAGGALAGAYGGGAAGGGAAGGASAASAPTIPTTTLGTVTPLAGATVPGAIAGTTAGTVAGTTAATGGAGAVAGTTAAAGGGGILNRILQGAGGYEGLIADVLNGIGAWQASNTAQDATRVQMEYANRALDLQTRMYDETKANQQPFVALGQQSANRLMNLAPYSQTFRPGGGSTGIQAFAPGMDTSGPTNNAQQAPSSLGSLGGNSPSAQRPGAGVDFVMVEAPDGTRRQMPRQAAQQFVNFGARIVG